MVQSLQRRSWFYSCDTWSRVVAGLLVWWWTFRHSVWRPHCSVPDTDPGYMSRKNRKFETNKLNRFVFTWAGCTYVIRVNGWFRFPALNMSYMSHIFRFFHLSNLSVLILFAHVTGVNNDPWSAGRYDQPETELDGRPSALARPVSALPRWYRTAPSGRLTCRQYRLRSADVPHRYITDAVSTCIIHRPQAVPPACSLLRLQVMILFFSAFSAVSSQINVRKMLFLF